GGVRSRTASTRTARTRSDVVVDPALSHQLFEFLKSRRWVGAVETADGHDRLIERELIAGGLIGSRHRCGPGVVGGIFGEQLGEFVGGIGAVEQTAHAASAARGASPVSGVAVAGGSAASGSVPVACSVPAGHSASAAG